MFHTILPFSKGDDFERVSLTVLCEILQQNLLGGIPQDEDIPPRGLMEILCSLDWEFVSLVRIKDPTGPSPSIWTTIWKIVRMSMLAMMILQNKILTYCLSSS